MTKRSCISSAAARRIPDHQKPAGEQIEVTVLGIKANQVRIGTAAPDDIAIVREELQASL